jgi:hypothetical protein
MECLRLDIELRTDLLNRLVGVRIAGFGAAMESIAGSGSSGKNGVYGALTMDQRRRFDDDERVA